jgi:hypothetical protein
MNIHEARLEIHKLITEALFELSDGPDLDSAGKDELREDMANATDVVLEVLDLVVDSVEDKHAKVSIRIKE